MSHKAARTTFTNVNWNVSDPSSETSRLTIWSELRNMASSALSPLRPLIFALCPRSWHTLYLQSHVLLPSLPPTLFGQPYCNLDLSKWCFLKKAFSDLASKMRCCVPLTHWIFPSEHFPYFVTIGKCLLHVKPKRINQKQLLTEFQQRKT